MKRLLFIFIAMTMCMPAFAITADQSRRSVSAQMIGPSASRRTASRNQLNPLQTPSVRVYPNNYDDEEEEDAAAQRERERAACEKNNIGIGNTFVWASRNSNTTNYATMVEDTKNPENNACFALVSITTKDPKIDLSDIEPRYFEMGRSVVCGEWVDDSVIEKRILKAKKTTRALATTGAVVGGIGLGVGAMELFGNQLIGGKVEGQKSEKLSEAEKVRSRLLTLKQKGKDTEYNEIMEVIQVMSDNCEKYKGNDSNTKAICNDPVFKAVFIESVTQGSKK